ncbi:FAD-dependent oxidoreductase [Kineococcus aurantiacus]|uniref:Cation diffusion facilitator CzcD-associated flavoprotein CzcO n=1 Tax=Kineococcus aurantiacus TaxID=37633 RepID=A0A7Y9ATE1_9ACTN|nr:cation diffusion facilitator CzcD-associated flavoprotein CzcO [Kineococcus aurantiacus]
MSAPVPEAAPVLDVAVVGAGFAGLGAAIRLHRRGRDSFVVLERAGEVGGTWRDNTYPGVACDVPSHLYSFSFAPDPGWSRVFAPGAEIQRYLRGCAREVADHLRLGCEVLRARWSPAGWWELATSTGPVRARVLVLAAGRLTEPRVPDVPGLADFAGPVLHTARWDHAVALEGLRVGVVGTGASAVQVVPELAGRAAHVSVFQRSPAWVVPRGDRAFSAGERARHAGDPAVVAASRSRTFAEMEQGLRARRMDRDALESLRRTALDHLAAQVPDPALRAALTPDYEIGCKRVLLSDTFYPALLRPDVQLVPSAVRSAGPGSVTARDGSVHRLDALVLATGFHSTVQPYAARVHGRDGTTLAQAWAGGMVSHASTVVHGFPNLFVLDGPNASLGHNSAIHVIESQIGYLLGALDHLAGGVGPLEVSAAAQRRYTAEIDAAAGESVWLRGGCSSWYVDRRSGRLTLLWPDTATEFRRRNGTFDPAPFL